jgi:hypothetical protein
MSKRFSTLLLPLFAFLSFLLFLYSFTQIDLGLALTRFPFLYAIQRGFQYVGYFNRPLSAWLYGLLVLAMFGVFALILSAVHKQKIKEKKVWMYLLIVTILLTFSYNAFSHDLFNYIFDAKIFTFYGKNPYAFKALDFPGDPMLGFMHWTHRVYPYGPAWLGLTIPLSYLGMDVFIVTFFLFKLLASAAFIGTAYFLRKIAGKLFPGKELFIVTFFAFNPFVLSEGLVSAHLDIVMMFFGVMSFYFLIQRRYWWALVLFALSVSVKFATIFLFPVFLAAVTMQVMKEKVPWAAFISAMCVSMLLSVVAAATQSGNFQPWYLLTVLPFAALIVHRYFAFIPSFILSAAAAIVYLPYLYLGHWDGPVQDILRNIYIVSILFSIVATLLYRFSKRKV